MDNLVQALKTAYQVTTCINEGPCKECAALSAHISQHLPTGLREARKLKYIEHCRYKGWTLTHSGRNFYRQLCGDFT